MDAVPATVPAAALSPGDTELLGPLSVLYAALVARLLELVAALPEDVQPGPNFYGLPRKPVLLTACLGIVSFAIFVWRTVLPVKERIYQVTVQQISEKVKNNTKENAELVQKVSNYEQKIKELQNLVQEAKKQNMILSDEAMKYKERDQQLSVADEKVMTATEEARAYKRRIQEMEEELHKTERSFKNQLATQEKKAHENWLKARNAERLMAEEKREAANLRHKLVEMTQKLAMQQDEPVIVKPLPGRPGAQNPPRRGPLSQNGSFGPSPVSGGECSPPPSAEPPVRPHSATFARRDLPRSDFDPGCVPGPSGNGGSRGSSPAKGLDEGKVNVAAKGAPVFPGPTFMGGPLSSQLHCPACVAWDTTCGMWTATATTTTTLWAFWAFWASADASTTSAIRALHVPSTWPARVCSRLPSWMPRPASTRPGICARTHAIPTSRPTGPQRVLYSGSSIATSTCWLPGPSTPAS